MKKQTTMPKKPKRPCKPSKPTEPSRTYCVEVSVGLSEIFEEHSDMYSRLNIESLCEELRTFTNAEYRTWYSHPQVIYKQERTLSDEEYAKEMKKHNTQLRHYEKKLKAHEEKMAKYQEKLELYKSKLKDYHDYKIKKEVDKILKQSKRKGIHITEEEATKIVRLQVLKQ